MEEEEEEEEEVEKEEEGKKRESKRGRNEYKQRERKYTGYRFCKMANSVPAIRQHFQEDIKKMM